MIKKVVTRSRTTNWNRIFSVLLTVALLVPLAVMAPAPDVPPRAQPVLLAMAAQHADDAVRVIVQKQGKDTSVEDLVARLGGAVTKDLRIIDAFAAELPAKAVPALARAAGVRWVSLDAPVESTGKPVDPCTDCPPNYYLDTLGVRQVWDMGLRGEGLAVAVVDSGIFTDRDFTTEPGKPHSRIKMQISFNPDSFKTADATGHGTHVTGIIGGNGYASGGFYSGIAPKVDLINLKISDENGMAHESDTVDAMQWALDYKDQYNIRVVNLSVNSVLEQSYHTSPLDAAAEILWFNGIVVVASAGNKGSGSGHNTADAAPANDPFIITVGASNEHSTPDIADDTVAPFSAYGVTMDGFVKPDIVAPGKDIISVLSDSSSWDVEYPDRVVLNGEYFRLSGTSMAAPMVTGAVALLLQDEPDLTPDQVKYRLMLASNTIQGDSGDPNSYPYLNVYAAVTGTTTGSANAGIMPHQLLAKMALMAYWANENCGDPCDWSSVNWDSVNWDSVNWDSVNWDSVNWDSVNWDSVNWDSVNWDSVNWDSVNWDSVNWDSVNWDSVSFSSVNWED